MSATDGNLYAHFDPVFQRCADSVALSTPQGDSWLYSDLERSAARLTGLLQSLGLKPGDRVSAQVPKSPELLCLYLACLRGGFVFHPLNPAYTLAELEFFFADAEPALLVCTSARQAALRELADRHGIGQVLTLDADGGGLWTMAAEFATPGEFAPRDAQDTAVLLYSSGTTGVPKGIPLSHDNLLSNAQALVSAWEFSAGDVLLHALPIFHVHGLFVATHCALLSAARMHWLPAYDVEAVLEALPSSTVMMGVPTYYTRLLDSPAFGEAHCRNMRLFISGSAPLLQSTFTAFERRTGQRILERYGMTETGMNASNPLRGERRAGSVGLPLPGVELRVVDDNDAPVAAGEVGNLQVRGRNVFREYWRRADKTREDFTDEGFFRTGDQAQIAQDGYLSIVGRAKDMIISGGLNVYPKEVESALDAHPQVAESAVVGVPHRDFGEGVVALVVPAGESVDDLQVAVDLSRRLAPYKLPKKILSIEALPRNSMGKVQKSRLREAYRDLFS